MRKISIRITDQHYEMLETLVQIGEYASVSEAIRDAIRKLIAEKSELIEKQQKMRPYI
jgi:antitoxin ParD1/3/4